MTGQLNTNLLNSNSEEIQEELDTLSNRLDGVESVTSANTDKINEVDNKVDNLANCVSTDSLKATNVAACNIQGSSATITDINSDNITVSNKLKAANIEADNITGTINGNVSANTIDAATANIATANVTEKITAATAEITDINATNANISQSLNADTLTTNCICNNGNATITGCLNVKGIELTNSASLTGNAIDVCNVLARTSLCTIGNATIDGDLTVKGNITGTTICGKVDSTKADITNATIDNLTVNNTLTIADGITLPNTLGDTTLTKVTTDSLIVNGDTELNGAVKAGSIAIGDGSITAGEVCIGAKGIVIDKNKNGDFNNINARDINTSHLGVLGNILADCIELLDSVVSRNTFAKNLYPKNITIDKNVGDLHYSRQLDTDAVGGVLVDCKTVTPVEVTHSLFPKNGYIESEISAKETTYARNKALEYSKRGNGLSVSSKVYRPDICSSSYKTAVKFITGCSDPGITGCCGKGFTVQNNGDNSLSVSYFYDNCNCHFIDYNFCDTNKNTSTVISSCSLDVTSKNINVKNISTCSVSDDNKVLKVDTCGNVYSGKITSSLIGNDCVCCTHGYTCLYQAPTMKCCYQICCVDGSSGCSYKENIDEKYYYCNTKKLCNVSVTDYGNKCGCEYVENITPMDRRYSYCKFGREYNPTTCVSCESYCLDCYCSELGNPTVLCNHYYCCCSNDTANTKNYWDEVRYFSGGRYNRYGLYPTYICRCFDGHPELSFYAQICNDNLYITNPMCNSEDILRVEDGKIYTKCGEFVAGGGGYFEDATFSNDCISGTRSIVNDTITTCVSDINDNNHYHKVSSIIVNPNGIVLSNNKLTYPAQCLAFCHKLACLCDWLVPVATYSNRSETREYNFIDNVMTVKNNSGCVICCHSPTSYVECSNDFDGCICTVCCSGYCDCAYISNISKYVECCYRHCKDYNCDSGLDCNYYECNCLGFQSVEAPTIWVLNWCNNKNIIHDGSKTPYCVGYSCSRSCNYKFCFENYRKDICACSCSYEGDCRVCYDCRTVHCDCSSIYERYFNGDCFSGCKYNTTSCQYEYFFTESCIDISDFSICKIISINENGISLKEKVTTNQIANLPITNTLVPLAGTVNGNGFAFFCKGADGTKFYDSSFATVDAGSAIDITYLVTTGV